MARLFDRVDPRESGLGPYREPEPEPATDPLDSGFFASLREDPEEEAYGGDWQEQFARLSAEVEELRAEVGDFNRSIGRCALLFRALHEAVLRQGLITREDFARIYHEMDMLDGEADGQIAQP